MQKDDLIYIAQMLDLARSAVAKVAAVDRRGFDADENLRLAVTHLVQTIGEAARHVSPAFRSAHPDIPWREIIGMRDKVVHDYMHVDFDIVWDVATLELSPLRNKLEALVSPECP